MISTCTRVRIELKDQRRDCKGYNLPQSFVLGFWFVFAKISEKLFASSYLGVLLYIKILRLWYTSVQAKISGLNSYHSKS